jgi:phosphoadenosine phosphosulfate reductase
MLKQFIEEHKIKSIVCCFSGGKDSLCSTHYTLSTLKDYSIKKYVCFVDTTVMIPDIIEYVNKIFKEHFEPLEAECHILKPKTSFWDMAKDWGVPQKNRRWCCFYLKLQPLYEFSEKIPHPLAHVLGLRKTESRRRKDFTFSYHDVNRDIWKINPIIEWSDKQVLNYIKENHLPISPHYSKGVQETCICGAFTTKKTLKALRAYYPDFLEKFAQLEDSFKKKGSAFYIGKKIYAKDLLKQKTIEEYSRG